MSEREFHTFVDERKFQVSVYYDGKKIVDILYENTPDRIDLSLLNLTIMSDHNDDHITKAGKKVAERVEAIREFAATMAEIEGQEVRLLTLQEEKMIVQTIMTMEKRLAEKDFANAIVRFRSIRAERMELPTALQRATADLVEPGQGTTPNM